MGVLTEGANIVGGAIITIMQLKWKHLLKKHSVNVNHSAILPIASPSASSMLYN